MDASLSAPVSLLKPAPEAPGASADRAKIARTAKDFEASFVSIMLNQMFEGVGGGEFSGGQGEKMFQSFLMDAFSKQMTNAGGIGLSAQVQREMLKLQGLEG